MKGITKSRPLRAFLCHSSGDKEVVRKLNMRLRAAGVDTWFDEENLLAGQDWHLEITKAVHNVDAVIVCLSNGSISKSGFVHKEIKYALDVAEEQPEGANFIIPLRLEKCDVPQRLRQWHWVDFFESQGFERLMNALKTRAKDVGAIISFSFTAKSFPEGAHSDLTKLRRLAMLEAVCIGFLMVVILIALWGDLFWGWKHAGRVIIQALGL